VGETVVTDEGYVGSAVNVAARVCAQAAAGELLVTDAVRSLTRTYLGVTFLPRGRKRLKGISEPISLYRVVPASAGARASRWRSIVARWPIAAAAPVILLVVVASALIGGVLIRGTIGAPGSGSSESAGPTTRAAESTSSSASARAAETFPTGAETALLQLLPTQDREHCRRGDPDDRPVALLIQEESEPSFRRLASVSAGIECSLGGISAPDVLWLWDVNETRVDTADSALATHGGLADAVPGTCRAERPAFETWSFGPTSGRLVCYESTTGDAVLLWTLDATRLFGKAVRDDQDMSALLDWWERAGRFAAP
jgi:hypothetical protein